MKTIALALLLASCATTTPSKPTASTNEEGFFSAKADPTKTPQSLEAEAQAKKWLDALGSKDVVQSLKSADKGLLPACATASTPRCPPDQSDTVFHYRSPEGWVSLHFKAPISPGSTLREVNKNLESVSLSRLAPDGVSSPGWDFSLDTPTSHIEEGFEVIAFDGKKISMKLKTALYAISGRDTECLNQQPTDTPTPARCIFEIRKSMQLALSLELTIW